MQTLKNKISKFLLSVGVISLMIIVLPAGALAASVDVLTPTDTTPKSAPANPDCNTSASPKVKGGTATNAEIQKCLNGNPIVSKMNDIVNFLAAGVGIVVTGSIIFGAIQYSAAGNNPQAVTAAKKRIADALIALFAFIFMYAFLQWLIPGGAPLIHL
jgi:hypothetical protein